MRSPRDWVRPHLHELRPYTTARDLFGGGGRILLDANESATPLVSGEFGSTLNRYPDPRCTKLRTTLASWLNVDAERLWLGNGSDEALDLALRTFVEPGETVVICPPTYGMYRIAARAYGAAIREAELDSAFDLDVEAVLRAAEGAKLIFLCSPNNPTGNRLSRERIERLIRSFDGPVLLDEAYVEFSAEPSLVPLVSDHRNLLVLRTFSKAWALAGARVGYMVADPEVVDYLDRINLPYPLNALSTAAAERALSSAAALTQRVERIVSQRGRLGARLATMGFHVLPSDANFLLVRIPHAAEVFRRLAEDYGIVVRDRSSVPRLEDCLRITVGEAPEVDRLCQALEEISG